MHKRVHQPWLPASPPGIRVAFQCAHVLPLDCADVRSDGLGPFSGAKTREVRRTAQQARVFENRPRVRIPISYLCNAFNPLLSHFHEHRGCWRSSAPGRNSFPCEARTTIWMLPPRISFARELPRCLPHAETHREDCGRGEGRKSNNRSDCDECACAI